MNDWLFTPIHTDYVWTYKEWTTLKGNSLPEICSERRTLALLSSAPTNGLLWSIYAFIITINYCDNCPVFMTHWLVAYRGDISSRFYSNSEANAS